MQPMIMKGGGKRGRRNLSELDVDFDFFDRELGGSASKMPKSDKSKAPKAPKSSKSEKDETIMTGTSTSTSTSTMQPMIMKGGEKRGRRNLSELDVDFDFFDRELGGSASKMPKSDKSNAPKAPKSSKSEKDETIMT